MTASTRPGTPAAAAEWRFAAAVTAVYAVMLVVALARHEMWRDELQTWMLARDSASLAELYANTRYEGHTGLWFVLLWVVSRITRSPVALQVVHGLVATGTVLLVALLAPFRRRWRALVPFGYFFAYEYAVLSRPYALGVLLLLAWCAVRVRRPDAFVLPAVLLALLANTSVFGLLLACAALAATAAPALLRPALLRGAWREPAVRRGLPRAGAIVALGVAAAVWWMVPPRTHVERVAGVHDRNDSAAVGAGLAPVRSFLPVPAPRRFPTVWQGNVLLHEGGARRRAVAAVLGVGLVLGGVLLLRRAVAASVLFGAFALAYLAFELLVYDGALRHHGHLVVAFVAALWLAHEVPRRARWLVDGVLLAQVAGAAVMLAADAVAPFSEARETAAFLRAGGRADGAIVAASGPPASSVAAYLDRPIVYADRGTRGTFMRWQLPVRHPPGTAAETAAVAAARRLAAAGPAPVTLLLPAPPARAHPGVRLTLLRPSAGGVISGEPFHVYDVRAPDAPLADARP